MPTLQNLPCADGVPIAMRTFEPSRMPLAVAILAPAMGAKQAFYALFAAWLAEQGVLAVTFDYRGMGESKSEEAERATILDWATLDCAAVLAHVRTAHPDLPVFWLGHSVGAQIFGLIPGHERVTAMLSIAAGSGYSGYLTRPLRYAAPIMWRAIMPMSVRGLNVAGKLGQVFVDSPRGVSYQWRAWCSHPRYLGSVNSLATTVAQSVVPITALSFADDEMMTLAGTKALFALYESSTVEVKRIEPREFGLSRIGHFGFFRASMQATLWRWALAWLEEKCNARAVAAVA
jgi:predicted alpha/beta hydrolase